MSGLIRVVASLGVDNLVVHVFYYLIVSDIWSDKRGWPNQRGTIAIPKMCIYPFYQCGYNSNKSSFVFSKETLHRLKVTHGYLFGIGGIVDNYC